MSRNKKIQPKRILSALLVTIAALLAGCDTTSTDGLLEGTFIDKPLAPEILYPTRERGIKNLNATIVWTEIQDTKTYEVLVAKDSDFTQHITGSPFIIDAPVTSLKLTRTELVECGTFYVRVKAASPVEGPFSTTVSFVAFDDSVYVYCPASEETCSDKDNEMNGTLEKPFRTISQAIKAATVDGLKVIVANRENDKDYSEQVNMIQGIHLLGGYDSNTWEKHTDNIKTKISIDASYVLSALAIRGETPTILDGFDINNTGSNPNNKYHTVYIDNSTRLEISNCRFNSAIGMNSITVYIESSSPLFKNNTINGSSGSYVGNLVFNAFSNSSFENNTFNMGDAYLLWGILNIAGNSTFTENTINRGAAGSTLNCRCIENKNNAQATFTNNTIYCNDATEQSYTFINNNSSAQFSGNTIYSGSGKVTIALYNNESSDIIITGNTIYGGTATEASTCIHNERSAQLIQNNSIQLGSSNNTTLGITNSSSNPEISNNTISGGTADNSLSSIMNTDSSPLIQNNTIQIGTSANSTKGISNSNSSPAMKNNSISGGTGTAEMICILNENNSAALIQNNALNIGSSSDITTGIANDNSSPEISGNTITGGTGTNEVTSIKNKNSSDSLIQNNTIEMADNTVSMGIANDNSSPKIYNNTIIGGISSGLIGHILSSNEANPVIYNNVLYGGDGSGTAQVIAIGLNIDSDSTVRNNTIFCADNAAITFGIMLDSSTAIIENNIVVIQSGSTRFGMMESGASATPAFFRNNNLFDTGSGGMSALYLDNQSGPKTTIADVNNMENTNFSGNVNIDNNGNQLFTDAANNDFSLSVTAPVNTRQGGLDGSAANWEVLTDFNNCQRTADTSGNPTNDNAGGWSIGAHESDGICGTE